MATQQQLEEIKKSVAGINETSQKLGAQTGQSFQQLSIPETITSADLDNQNTALDFKTTVAPTPTDITKFDSTPTEVPPTPEAPQLTPTEQAIQQEIEGISTARSAVADKEQFEAQKEREVGLLELRGQQEDIAAQIKGFQLESQRLMNERNFIEARAQQGAEGRGITVGGLAPRITGALRTNILKQADVTSRALLAQANLEATKGRITTAQSLVDQAVREKYAFQEREIETRLANLDLLMKSPLLSREQEARAEATQRRLRAEELALRLQESDFKAIQEFAVQAAKRGATGQQLALIQSASSSAEALQKAAVFLGQDFKIEMEDRLFTRSLQEAQYNLSVSKFNEDIRQFGERQAMENYKLNLQIARQQQEDAKAQGEQDKADTLLYESLSRQRDLISEIKNSAGLSRRVGPNVLARAGFTGPEEFFTGKGEAFSGYVHQLTSKATLQNLIDVKAQGATFGALQKAELDKLEQSMTAINDWEIVEGTGDNQVKTGQWKVTEEEFLKEIKIIEDTIQLAIDRATGVQPLSPLEQEFIKQQSTLQSQNFSLEDYYSNP